MAAFEHQTPPFSGVLDLKRHYLAAFRARSHYF
ncbi:hypothetical protein CCACVL1_07269 [Corchorus capsularis]|uniref:Uncharacterized protein n=1 Tax=Corchorus capsularis TaxID=210143 RepID=A0A1R3J7P1_COCAP|nr:hypothetical protein CCACVL1_07269 [Corchorus capsularis]